jgi:hypothetical protein
LEMGPSELFLSPILLWPQAPIFPILVSHVARITDVSHQHPTTFLFSRKVVTIILNCTVFTP